MSFQMKRLLALLMIVLALPAMTGCGKKAPGGPAVTFVNEVEEASFWILPQTPEILKTTVWGTATAAKLGTGRETALILEEPAEAGTYIFRAIGTEGMYYEANGIEISEGSLIRFCNKGQFEQVLQVTGPDGGETAEYEICAARL